MRQAAPGQDPSIVEKIVAGARRQIGAGYDPAYRALPYPNGDVPRDRGVCTDVVIRALRTAGFDLQRLIHEDMRRNFGRYPRRWGLRRPDPSIDHRRVPNQMTFFRRHALVLTVRLTDEKQCFLLCEWEAGDIVYWKLPNGRDHCGVLAFNENCYGMPYVVHNLSRCVEEDCLDRWKIIGHFRYPKPKR